MDPQQDTAKPASPSSKPKRRGGGHTPSDAVYQRRIGQAIAIIASRPNIRRCQLHEILCAQWGVHWKTVDRAVGRARAELIKRLNRPKSEFRCDVLTAYEKEAGSPDPKVRLAALAGIRELLGLDEPKYVHAELTGANGGPIESLTAYVDANSIRSRVAEAVRAEVEVGAMIDAGLIVLPGNGGKVHGNGGNGGNRDGESEAQEARA